MDNHFAIAIVAAVLGLAGCATDPTAASGRPATKDEITITGSRIPPKPTAAQMVKSVSGEAWRRESSPVIGNQPKGN